MIINEKDELDCNVQETASSEEEKKLLHRTIKKVGEDLEAIRLNTAISDHDDFRHNCLKIIKTFRNCKTDTYYRNFA